MELTQEYLKDHFYYNKKTGVFVKKIYFDKRGRKRGGKEHGSLCENGYIILMINYKRYLSHRLAWFYVKGEWPENEIDHINGIRSDNRFCNLREASRSQNQQNRKKAQLNNKSTGIIGTYVERATGKFYSSITLNRKQKRLGTFNTVEQAHNAYIKAKRELHTFGML